MSVIVILTTLAATLLAALPTHADGPTEHEIAAVRERLAALQMLSFATNREYCGYLLRKADGSIGFTDMVRGGNDGCTPLVPISRIDLIASVHTHGAYDPDVPAEFPTALDMKSDRREQVNGFVATPGGRLWYIDTHAMITRQLCGPGCLPQDPNFHPGDDGQIAQVYTYEELLGLESPE